jgi:hypothetical protein
MRWRGGSARVAMNVAVGVVAFAGGVLAWAAIGGDDPPNGRDQAAATNDPTAFTIPFGEFPASSEASRPSVPASEGGAATAADAVDGFLRAEVSGDYDNSFRLLSTTDRATYRSAARWTQSHSSLPPIIGYEITSAEQPAGADRVQITATLMLEPALDETVGLVPARAEATWISVREAELWRVSLAESVLTASWPRETEASDQVRAWASSLQACEHGAPVAAEWSGGLIGTAALAADLCDVDGRLRLGPVEPLDLDVAETFTAAFGEDIVELARIVPVLSPVELRAVVAPLGDEWLVVGALPPPP